MDRFLIVDGSNLLFQMFFGMPARIVNSRGRPIQGTLGFVGALLKIIRMVQPTHVAVIFDGEGGGDRAAINPDYKANRPDYSAVPEEETPFSQLDDVYAALDYMGIRHAETTDCEADDVIAGYARELGRAAEVVISSFDSDFFQLVTDRVSVLRYRGQKTVICTPGVVREKFGVAPEQYADFKSLTGDNADNIKGAEGVGPKTAAMLIRTFGTLEGVLAETERIARAAVRESIVRNAGRLRNNYRIIRLSGAAELPFAPDALKYECRGMTTTDVLKGAGLR